MMSFTIRMESCPVPQGHPISKLGSVVEKQQFENLKSEYYRLRGWDENTGYPTKSKLNELQLGDVAVDLSQKNLII